MKNNAIIVLDLGTSSFKCGTINPSLRIIAQDKTETELVIRNSFCELDFENAYHTAIELIKQVIAKTIARNYDISALLITSQAQTFVPVDKHFIPLAKGIVWLDARAEEEGKFLTQKVPDFSKKIGFIRASARLYISKLLWLKCHQEMLFRQAAYFPLFSEYFAYRLTNRFYTDYTNFGMSGMLDIHKRVLNHDALLILDLKKEQFPEMGKASHLAFPISADVRQHFDLNYSFPVYLCGNDQSASAFGAGVSAVGDMSVNFGTAMVFYAITEKPIEKIESSQIVGIDPLTDNYFLICCENQFGNIIDQLKKKYFSNASYDAIFSTYYSIKEKDDLINFKEIENVIDSAAHDPGQITGSMIQYFVDRFKHNLSNVESIVTPNRIYISGGGAQSKIWLKILQENCKYPLFPAAQQDAGIIGAAKIFLRNRNR